MNYRVAYGGEWRDHSGKKKVGVIFEVMGAECQIRSWPD